MLWVNREKCMQMSFVIWASTNLSTHIMKKMNEILNTLVNSDKPKETLENCEQNEFITNS